MRIIAGQRRGHKINGATARGTRPTSDLVRAIQLLKRHFDYVVIDGVRGLDERALQILDLSDQVVLAVAISECLRPSGVRKASRSLGNSLSTPEPAP